MTFYIGRPIEICLRFVMAIYTVYACGLTLYLLQLFRDKLKSVMLDAVKKKKVSLRFVLKNSAPVYTKTYS